MKIFFYTLLIILAFGAGRTIVTFEYEGPMKGGQTPPAVETPGGNEGADIFNAWTKQLSDKLDERDQIKREIEAGMLALSGALAEDARVDAERIAQGLHKLRTKLAELERDIKERRADLELQQKVIDTQADGTAIDTPFDGTESGIDGERLDVFLRDGEGDRPLDLLRQDMDEAEERAAVDAILAEEQARQDAIRQVEEVEFLQSVMDELNLENDQLRKRLSGVEGRASRLADEHAVTAEKLRRTQADAAAYRADYEELARANQAMGRELMSKTREAAAHAEWSAARDAELMKAQEQRQRLANEAKALRRQIRDTVKVTAGSVRIEQRQTREPLGVPMHRSETANQASDQGLAASRPATSNQRGCIDRPAVRRVELSLDRSAVRYNEYHRPEDAFSEVRLIGVCPDACSVRGPGGKRPESVFVHGDQLRVRFAGRVGFALVTADREPTSITFR